MTRMTRMGTGFVMVENLFRGHSPSEPSWHRNSFLIRVIREIRGSNCGSWVQRRFSGLGGAGESCVVHFGSAQ